MKETVWFALILLALLIFFGLYAWAEDNRRNPRVKHEQDAPDYIPFDRCSVEEFDAKVLELRESMEGKREG